jgi:hypothetical protein
MDEINIKNLICSAKKGNEKAIEEIVKLFQPCIYKNSFYNGKFDPDCYQELSIKLLDCINKFEYNSKDDILEFLNIND